MKPEEIAPVTDTIREEDLDEAVSYICESKKPYIFVGGGAIISDCEDELLSLIHI